jgi:hypothetical protein
MHVRNRTRIAVVLAMLATLLVGVPAGPAQATHGTQTLEVDPETQSAASGSSVTLTAQASAIVINLGGPEVDFEIESGPGDTDGNSPRTPDFTCNIGPLIFNTCSVSYTGNGHGIDFIRAWYDHDNNDATVEYDNDEGRAEETDAGAVEPDITDLVQVNWTQGPPAKLDCDDGSAGADPAATDNEENVNSGPGSDQSYLCKASDGAGVGMEGVQIDGENLSSDGINDPDQVGADYNNFCTTGGDGTCVGVVPANGPVGTADFCFWTDINNDAAYDPLAENEDGSANHADGGDCDAEKFDEPENNDRTDVVRITWKLEKVAPISRILRPLNGASYQQNAMTQLQFDATDTHSGIAKVQFALRRHFKNGTCSSWNHAEARFKSSACNARLWVDATFQEGDPADDDDDVWLYNLPSALTKSQGVNYAAKFYMVLSRAIDTAGNVEVIFQTGRNRNAFEIV